MQTSAVVFDVEHGATHDGPGLRTVVFLKGCPLRCRWCHNPESWRVRPEGGYGRLRTIADLMEEILRDRPFYDNSGGGLTLSGGEPLAHPAFVRSLLAAAKGSGLHTAVETSGCAPWEVVESVMPFVDLWLFDVKHLDAGRFRELTGGDLVPILANLRGLDAREKRIVLRLPMVPSVNDGDAELAAVAALADELASVEELDVEPYNSLGVEKGRRLGLATYAAPLPPVEYGPSIVARLSGLTRKRVCLS
ncbi:MAG: glycyl-radical enzyme activating protein [Kiritimatiellia bacterium]